MTAVFGLTGVWMTFSAAVDVAELTRGRSRARGWAPIAKLIGGGICFAIPEAAGVTWSSLFSMSTPEQSLGAQASGMSAPTNCLAASSSGSSNFNPVECVFHNLSVDCAPQFVLLVLVVAGCAGLFMWWQFVKASVEKVSYGDPSMKLPWGSAIIGTLFLGVGAVVEMFGTALGFAQGIITSNGFTSNSSMIAYLPNYSSLPPQYQAMLASSYAIIAAVGVFEVVRGGFLAASIMNGRSQTTGWKAATHMILGTALAFTPQVLAFAVYSATGQSNF